MSDSVRRSKRKASGQPEPPTPDAGPESRRARKNTAQIAAQTPSSSRAQQNLEAHETPAQNGAVEEGIELSPSILSPPVSEDSLTGEGNEEGFRLVKSIKSKIRWQAGASAALKSISASHDTLSPRIWSIGSLTEGLMSVSPQLRKRRLHHAQHGKVDAGHLNGNQAHMGEVQGTIWNAVRYPHTPHGRESWRVATEGTSERDWMVGRERGIMGETPLHLAVLYMRHEGEDSDQLVQTMWDNYPALRIAVYEKALYHGENVLHIAIVRRLGRHILEMFLESPQGSSLLRQRADGRFFKDPKLSDGCCNYGEFPLGFAACTNQKDTFDYLVSKGASLNFTTYEGHNLLHLMVLHSKKNVRSCGFDDEPDEPFEGGDDSESSKADQWCRDMYDHIEEHMRRSDMLESALVQQDQSNHTPLSLAAAKGSLEMFNHLFNKLMKIEWVFGPVACRKLCLLGIDVPLEQEVQEMRVVQCVMDVVVDAERLDILTDGQLKKILDSKWAKYAKSRFRQRFWFAIAFAFGQLFVTATDITRSDMEDLVGISPPRIVCQVILFLIEFMCGCLYLKDCKREIVRLCSHGITKYLDTSRAHVFERLHALFSSPLYILLTVARWRHCIFLGLGGVQNCRPMDMAACEAAGSGAVVNDAYTAFVRIMDCRYQPHIFINPVERFIFLSLSLCQSALSFSNIFLGMMGFPEYGHFVLMLKQMLEQDMLKMFRIYIIFLFGFSHMLYISSDQQNSGPEAFFDTISISFQAVLQQVDLNIESDKRKRLGPWWSLVVFGIVLCNFFLVSLVLINLLIAMMSSTYDDINNKAKRKWNLVRARIITNIDKEMTDAERCSEQNIFWNWEDPQLQCGRRVMTFTTSENLHRYLSGDVKKC